MTVAESGSEGLKLARLMMVLSSISPLFLLWAIRGTEAFPNRVFVTVCLLIAGIPHLVLVLRIYFSIKSRDTQTIVVGKAEDHRDHLLVYLFAILFPFYSASLSSRRELIAAVCVIAFIVFLFWQLNLHYMNFVFVPFGFRVFTIVCPSDDNPLNDVQPLVLLTRRSRIDSETMITAYRLSDTVFFETKSAIKS